MEHRVSWCPQFSFFFFLEINDRWKSKHYLPESWAVAVVCGGVNHPYCLQYTARHTQLQLQVLCPKNAGENPTGVRYYDQFISFRLAKRLALVMIKA